MNSGDEKLAESRITRKAGKSKMIGRSTPANLQGSTKTQKLLFSPSVKRKTLHNLPGGNPSNTQQPTKRFRSLQEFWERKVTTSQMDGTHYTVTKTPIFNLAVQFQQAQGETAVLGYLEDIQSDQYNLDDGNTSSEVNEL